MSAIGSCNRFCRTFLQLAMPPAKPEEEQPRGDGSAATHLLAFALGAVSVGAALLVRALQKKLRKRRRVVSTGRERPRPAAPPAGLRPAGNGHDQTATQSFCPQRAPMSSLHRRHPPPAATARNRLRSAAACCPKQQLCHLPTAAPSAGGRASGALPVVALPRQAAGAHPGQADDPAHLRAGLLRWCAVWGLCVGEMCGWAGNWAQALQADSVDGWR